MPPSDRTATSVVPPPMSTISEPDGSDTGSPAPIAAAMGSSIRRAQRAPALRAASRTARFSTSVTPDGMPSSIRGRGIRPTRSCTLFTKYLIICSVTSKSLMTPSRSGRTAMIEAGVRPTMRLASAPMARTRLVLASMATTDGSEITIPRSRTCTSVFAVPRSIPMSREKRPRSRSSMREASSRCGGQSNPHSAQAAAVYPRPACHPGRVPQQVHPGATCVGAAMTPYPVPMGRWGVLPLGTWDRTSGGRWSRFPDRRRSPDGEGTGRDDSPAGRAGTADWAHEAVATARRSRAQPNPGRRRRRGGARGESGRSRQPGPVPRPEHGRTQVECP